MATKIDEVVVVNINRETVGITQAGFGTPLVFGEHTKTAEKIKEYASIEEVASDFATSDLEYLKAVALFSQEIKPEKIKIGKRAANVKQKVNVTVPTIADSTSYKVTINGQEFEYVSGVSATQDSIVDGLIAAIGAGSEPIGTTDNVDDFDIEANTAGEGFSITTTANLAFTQTTANVSVVSELQDIQDIDDDFYFVILTSSTKFDILQMAAYIETQRKIFFALSNDADVKTSIAHIQTLTTDADYVASNTIDLKVDGNSITQVTFTTDHDTTMGLVAQAIQDLGVVATATVTGPREITVTGANPGQTIDITEFTVTGGASQPDGVVATTQDPAGDVASVLEANNYNRTALVYSGDTSNEVDAAWVGLVAPEDPGSVNWAFKTLSGVVADDLTSNEKSIIHGKRGNTYTTVGGKDITQQGTVAKSPNFIDVIRGDDFTQARLQEKIFGILVSNNKVPYTEGGLDIIRAGIEEVMDLTVRQGIYSDAPAPKVNMPAISSISAADKEARELKGITIDVIRAGAINKVTLQVNISL